MERNLRSVAIAVVLVSIVTVSFMGINYAVYPNILQSVSCEDVDHGFYCGIRAMIEYVIDNNMSWGSLWTNIHNISSGTPVLPSVDFETEVVIAVFIGEFSTGGYSVDIKRIEVTVWGFIIHVEETHPGEGCGLTMAFTQPYHIVKANVTSLLQVNFVYDIVIHDCSEPNGALQTPFTQWEDQP